MVSGSSVAAAVSVTVSCGAVSIVVSSSGEVMAVTGADPSTGRASLRLRAARGPLSLTGAAHRRRAAPSPSSAAADEPPRAAGSSPTASPRRRRRPPGTAAAAGQSPRAPRRRQLLRRRRRAVSGRRGTARPELASGHRNAGRTRDQRECGDATAHRDQSRD